MNWIKTYVELSGYVVPRLIHPVYGLVTSTLCRFHG